MNHATPIERSQFVAGLRQLADFLEARTDVPAPRWADVHVFAVSFTDDEMRREIDAVAALIGSEVDDGTAERLNYTASRNFGPVQYRAVAIPSTSRYANKDEEA
jgi:hypothetical protein